jgi:hypothetical protein
MRLIFSKNHPKKDFCKRLILLIKSLVFVNNFKTLSEKTFGNRYKFSLSSPGAKRD